MSVSDDQPPKLYAAREPIFPKRVSGFFRTLKWWIMAVTLGIYYLTPWFRWDRGPDMPDQAVLVDLANRRFFFLWIEIWPHEFYFVAGLLIMAGLGLFLFTSALGRVWCGYTCPQTVWTDLFLLVERWVEGDRNARIRLYRQDWNSQKARLRITKWVLWLLISVATGGAWVFYFADAPTLLRDLLTGQAAYVAYASVALLTATTFIFGGFMREQVCVYMCPWPRIQAAMMDEETLTVAYRDHRGEPRGKGNVRRRDREEAEAAVRASRVAGEDQGPGGAVYKGTPFPGRKGQAVPHVPKKGEGEHGDCIDCMACVNVCPMGIDIRDGQQLECITCALCIDACDDIMARLGKPRGLIDYITLSDDQREKAGGHQLPAWRHIFRVRTIMYTALWSVVGIALVVALFIRPDIDISVAPERNPVFVTLSNGAVRDAYTIRIRNKNGEPRRFALSVTSDAPLALSIEGVDGSHVEVPADDMLVQRIYLTAPARSEAARSASEDVRIWIEDTTSRERAYADTVFHGDAK